VPVLAKTPIKLTSKKELNMTKSKTPMTPEAAARIQREAAKQNHGQVKKDSFAARAKSAADKHSNTQK
jgi:hypothetical protein